MIKLSLALGYIHYGLKRQADNRHYIILQGLASLQEYYEDRVHSCSFSERQEAEYNMAHAYHILGLTHLAVPYYERCLVLSRALQADHPGGDSDGFTLEAAVNLQGLWAASGNAVKSQEITEKWMVL